MVRYIRTIFGVMDSTIMVEKSKVKKYIKRGYEVYNESKNKFMIALEIIKG